MIPQNWRFPTIWEMRRVASKIKNIAMNYTDLESKTREATNNEPWGSQSELMYELARATWTPSGLEQVLGMVIQRLAEARPTQWRPTYKCFLLLEFLLKNGSNQVKEYLIFHQNFILSFTNALFDIVDENGKSQGINIRTRAAVVVGLIENEDDLERERRTASENQGKYLGHGNQESWESVDFDTRSVSISYSQKEPTMSNVQYHEDNEASLINFD
jgi:epsin